MWKVTYTGSISEVFDSWFSAFTAYNAEALLVQYFIPSFLVVVGHPTKIRYCSEPWVEGAHTTWPTLTDLSIPLTTCTSPLWKQWWNQEFYTNYPKLFGINMGDGKPIDVDNKKCRLPLSSISFSPIIFPVPLAFPATTILVWEIPFLVAHIIECGLHRGGLFRYICYTSFIQVPRDSLKPIQ